MDTLEMLGNSSMPDMMRMMTFHFSHTVPLGLLFKAWTVNSVLDLIGAVIVWFILAILYEGLKTLREYLIYLDMKHWKKHNSKRHECNNSKVDEASLMLSEESHGRPKGFRYYSLSISMHVIQSALHVVQVGYGYLLMLVIMTFNGWLFLSICFGAGVGYLLFAKSRHLMGNFRAQNEQCH